MGMSVLPQDGIYIGSRSHRKAILIAVAVLAAIVVGAAVVVALLPVMQEDLGPAPTWHSFSGVFDNTGQLATESCSFQNLGPGFVGIGHTITPTTIVVCTYHGASYTGYYDTDCNLVANGPPESINGSAIPFDGCVLSTLPLNTILNDIFSLSNQKTNNSISIYSGQNIVANMTPAENWKTYRCSLLSDNSTRVDGPLNCVYLGTPYVASDVLQDCNLGAPIQVNGVSIPAGSCNLARSEQISG